MPPRPEIGRYDEYALYRLYRWEIAQKPRLTTDEETTLGHTITLGRQAHELLQGESELPVYRRNNLEAEKKQGEDAEDVLVEGNLHLVIPLAKRYSHATGLSLMDLIQDGNWGLMEAAHKFDPEQEAEFRTHAWYWIRAEIVRGIQNKARTIRVPVDVGQQLPHLRDAELKLRQETGNPNRVKLAAMLGITEDRLHDLDAGRAASNSISLSLFEPTDTDDGTTPAHLPKPTTPESSKAAKVVEHIHNLAALGLINARGWGMLRRRFMDQAKIEDVAEEHGLKKRRAYGVLKETIQEVLEHVPNPYVREEDVTLSALKGLLSYTDTNGRGEEP